MYSYNHNMIQEEITKTLNEIDRSYLRKIQGDMHKCAAHCCENRDASMEYVSRCIEDCGSKMRTSQTLVQNEFEHFRDRINRCYMSCQDRVRDKIGPNPSEPDIQRYGRELEECSKECDISHVVILSNLSKRVKELFSKNDFQSNIA